MRSEREATEEDGCLGHHGNGASKMPGKEDSCLGQHGDGISAMPREEDKLPGHHATMPWAGGPYSAWRKVFPGRVASVPEVRSWARDLLAGRVAAPVLDDVLLLLSELAANAVAHSDSGRTADGRLAVYLARTTTMVHVEVTDDGSVTSAPAVRVPEADGDGGRGLWLVDLLAAEWGSRCDGASRSVWFQVTG